MPAGTGFWHRGVWASLVPEAPAPNASVAARSLLLVTMCRRASTAGHTPAPGRNLLTASRARAPQSRTPATAWKVAVTALGRAGGTCWWGTATRATAGASSPAAYRPLEVG